ncbi:hypothetical protein GEMRC1_003781 [Eukaryota sp. GEM-RC1]
MKPEEENKPKEKEKPQTGLMKTALGKRRTGKTSEGKGSAQTEVLRYTMEETVETEATDWWKQNFNRYPRLSAYAKNYMTAQASSVPSEQLFSQAGCVVTKLRASLSSDSIEAVLCLKSWFKCREMRELFMNQR